MAENTKNLNLKKPAQNDFYNVDDFNENFQKLDEFAGRKDNPHGVTAKQIGAVPMLNGLDDGVDINSVTNSGFYRLNRNPINVPSGNEYGQMIVVHGGNDTITQMVFPHNLSKMFLRNGNPSEIGGSGGWKEWVEVYTSSHEVAKIEIGSYVGGGTYGENNKMRLLFNFQPKFVAIGTGLFAIRNEATTIYMFEQSSHNLVNWQWDGNLVSFWNNANATNQCNNSGVTYNYVAIG